MDFVFGLPRDRDGNTGIVVFVDRLSKMDHLAAAPETIDGKSTAQMFIDRVYRHHGLPLAIVSDRDPRFTRKFWTSVFKVLGIRLKCPQRIIRRPMVKLSVLIASLMTFCSVFALIRLGVGAQCSLLLSLQLINSVHASTGFTPFT